MYGYSPFELPVGGFNTNSGIGSLVVGSLKIPPVIVSYLRIEMAFQSRHFFCILRTVIYKENSEVVIFREQSIESAVFYKVCLLLC